MTQASTPMLESPGAPTGGGAATVLPGLDRQRAARDAGFEVPVGIARADLAASPAAIGASADRVLQAAFAGWLWRMSGLDAIVIGVQQAGSAEALAVEVAPAGDWSRVRLLASIDEATAAATSRGRIALDAAAAGAAGGSCFGVGIAAGAAHARLAEVALATGDDDGLVLRFAAGCASDAAARRVAGHLRVFLQAFVAGGDATLAELPMLDAATRTQMLEAFNPPATAFPSAHCIHWFFEDHARCTPEAIALEQGDARLTYGELNARANRLARQLRAMGVRADDLVAVCCERGFGMVTALLAALKAGAGYVPVDPAYPPERIAHMLADSAPKAVLAHAATLARVQGLAPVEVLDVDATGAAWHALSGDDLDRDEAGAGARNLAYVIYTSGSTGQPKGVAIEHRGLCNLVLSIGNNWGPEPVVAGSRLLQYCSFSFDASQWEIHEALTKGATLHLLPAGTVVAGAALAQLLDDAAISHGVVPPAVLATLPPEAPLPSLRTLVVGGDVLPAALARHWSRRFHLINGYGPSEITVCATMHLCDPDDPGDPPIGTVEANTRAYVLDPLGEPVPVGVTGELYIGGVGVARGYLDRPALNAERFLPDPFTVEPDARMYRTGDLARWRADGSLEFAGRNDFQVKLRGFRIELGEIESRLRTHPGVADAAVVVREDRPGDKRIVAYCVPAPGAADAHALAVAWREHVAAALPGHMVPSAFVCLPALPLTHNGKLDRRALPAPAPTQATDEAPEPPVGEAERAVCAAMAGILGVDAVGRDDHFFEVGGNSLLAVRLADSLSRDPVLGVVVPVTAVFRHPTPARLAAALAPGAAGGIEPARLPRGRAPAGDGREPIAIVAMAGRFPGADSVEDFWDNLLAGVDSITRFERDTLDPAVPAAERDDPAYVPARGVIEGAEQFDAAFFGISPREAELMDPQQRIFLELCWECMERGGHVPGGDGGPVGVFAGMNNGTYLQRHVAAHPDLAAKLGAVQVAVANEKDYIATRVAHKLDLTGPALSIHTACSTSLVAVCQAVDSLRSGQCDMALAGGASVTCPPRSGYLYQEGAMLSPDGHTRTFDREARGTVFSDGAVAVLLKRLSDAVADGDQVHAVILGGALNNDGGGKASFTAPSSEGQAAVVAMAHRNAGVDPRSIGYVEAHGTATPLGDPIEVEGLTRAFRLGTADAGFCRIGSVKSNVGHLVAAAGAAGLVKAALSLRERVVPATLHYTAANPTIPFAGSPFVVNDAAWRWDADAPRRAGVSSFGVGGTNAHVVLQEAPALPASPPAEGAQLLVLSARTPHALGQAAQRLATHLETHPDENLADVAWTLARGRKAFAHRIALTAGDPAAAVEQLRSLETAAAAARSRPARGGDVVFLFPGQGAQYAGMGRALYAAQPAFREAFDACAAALDGCPGFAPGAAPGDALRTLVFGDDAEALLPTSVMQPATFAIEYAAARLWLALGLRPSMLVGHSIGEFVAATLAGVFPVEDAIRLVATRGRLMQAQPEGSMLSVRLGAEPLQARLPAELSLAAENGANACVVAGPSAAVAAFKDALEADGIACRPLRTSHAFHSAMMAPVVAPFRDAVAALALSAPRIPILSTVTGAPLGDAEARDPGYWAGHLRAPVRFAPALDAVLEAAPGVLLEVGPRATLAGLARQRIAATRATAAAVASLGDASDGELAAFQNAAGQLWCHGALDDVDLFDARVGRRRVRLPSYPFERKRYWVDALPATASAASERTPAVDAAAVAPAPQPPNLPEIPTSPHAMHANLPTADTAATPDRRPRLLAQLKQVVEDVAGFDLADADEDANFMELGLDSLNLTQVALQLQRSFAVKVTFRQLMSDLGSLRRLVAHLDAAMPAEAAAVAAVAAPPAVSNALPTPFSGMALSGLALSAPTAPPAFAPAAGVPVLGDASGLQQVIQQQMAIMAQQLAMLAGAAQLPPAAQPPQAQAPARPAEAPPVAAPLAAAAGEGTGVAVAAAEDDDGAAQARYDANKSFGAIARIHTARQDLDPRQRQKLDAFVARYVARTPKSKAYNQAHRARMADPRVVSGFRPQYKEIVYQTVMERSRGARLWDIDGNEYIDANNGFGISLFGWQPPFVVDAVREVLDRGYEIGPQHPLSGEVADLVCELTGHDRAALCNTGSEAVLGALRIARTVTGRSLVAVFNGSYHGINDEVVIRGNRKHQAMPGAPGILRNACENTLVLDYGTPEALELIRMHADELAAVIVEPVQSRRADFQPVEFLREVRRITEASGTAFIFDEVITGFRFHPGGTQAMFGVKADIATYGKVIGGGYPLGVIAGRREWMDALDGGHWEFGDDSAPTVGVTYFAGTFVRHPLALAAAHAVLTHLKAEGPALQERLNTLGTALADDLNGFLRDVGAPIEIKQFCSLWRTAWLEDHPLQDLLYAMMRSRGVHILDNFPCFITTAHTEDDVRAIAQAYKDSVLELQEAGFLPRRAATPRTVMDPAMPPAANARLGREPDGRPAWFVPDEERPGKYRKVV